MQNLLDHGGDFKAQQHKYHRVCKHCDVDFLARSPNTNACPSCAALPDSKRRARS